MKDKKGRTVRIGSIVKSVDFIGGREVIAIHEAEDSVVTQAIGGSSPLRSSRGMEEHGWIVVVGRVPLI